ncbi:MAG: hypothetical protein KatS3mg131_0480 [Candidatus Tectimicrobiota bacterium]|nr:MAG: hypothetical protein KatS3mg131_0480 [Candidatus Tectomicrobia bacterium]
MSASVRLVLVAGFVVGLMLMPGAGMAQEEKAPKPERLLTMAAEYPGVEVSAGENVEMDLIFHNKGRSDETVRVWIEEQPEGWQARLKTYRYTITGVHVPADSDKRVTFKADPPKDVAPGEYTFRVAAQTRDGQFRFSEPIVVKVTGPQEEKASYEDVTLTTTYPVLRGPTDATFEFSVEVNSDLDEDTVFDLFAEGPRGWEINFKPAYESKYISSLQVKANQSRTVSVEVKPSFLARPGEYPIKMRVSAGKAKAELDLMVVLTGTYKLDAGTPSGLLSLETQPGKPANVSIYVKNTGSAVNRNITFLSFKPENWKVEFNPEKIEALEPGEVKQVEVTITPYEDALIGDYSVAVEVRGERASKTLEFRTTVRASAAWGWVGVLIIAGVIGGLTALFRKFGRR